MQHLVRLVKARDARERPERGLFGVDRELPNADIDVEYVSRMVTRMADALRARDERPTNGGPKVSGPQDEESKTWNTCRGWPNRNGTRVEAAVVCRMEQVFGAARKETALSVVMVLRLIALIVLMRKTLGWGRRFPSRVRSSVELDVAEMIPTTMKHS